MARHQYGNTETSDLWDALEAETGEPVRRIAESWIFQGGFPEVTVSAGAGGDVSLAQQRFRFGPADGAGTGDVGERWAVPVVLEHRPAGGGEPATRRVLLEGPTVAVDAGGDGGAVNANAGAHGFYRVRYTGAAGRPARRPRRPQPAGALHGRRRRLGVGAGRHDGDRRLRVPGRALR